MIDKIGMIAALSRMDFAKTISLEQALSLDKQVVVVESNPFEPPPILITRRPLHEVKEWYNAPPTRAERRAKERKIKKSNK